MTLEQISAQVTQWSRNRDEETLAETVRGLAEYLYLNLDRYRLEWRDEDKKCDFFSWLYPKFPTLIQKFDPAKASFSTYLYWNVRMSWKSFIRSTFSAQALHRVIEAEEKTRILCMDPDSRTGDYWVACTRDEESPYPPRSLEPEPYLSPKQRDIRARQILLLACKSSPFLNDSDIAKVSRATGFPEETLRTKIDELRAACRGKDKNIRQSRERVNALYFRVQRCKYEMKYLESDSSRYADLRRECESCERRLIAARRLASRHLKAPSNRLLAKTLGIPRGTVDSTLASAKPTGYDNRL